jgi:hypothetical protein
VFARSGSTWTQQAYVKASNTGRDDWARSSDSFGDSVALDGDTLAVGASGDDSDATGTSYDAPFSGAVYVFVRSGSTWTQQAYVKASNPGVEDSFGDSVALDGDTLVVGAQGEDSNATGVYGDQFNNDAPFSGAVYVYSVFP